MNAKVKAVLLLLVMYVLGAASAYTWQNCHSRRMRPPPAFFGERRIQRLITKLKLTPEQEQQVRNIFQKAHERASTVNKSVSWELAQIHRDSVQSIEKILTPEQLRQFAGMHQKYHDRHHFLPADHDVRPKAERPS